MLLEHLHPEFFLLCVFGECQVVFQTPKLEAALTKRLTDMLRKCE